MFIWLKLLFFVFLISQISSVFPANPNKDIAKCAAESNSIKRLECFDTQSNRLGVASPKTINAVISKWNVKKEISRIDDSTNVIVSLDADTPISGWPSKKFTPSLVMRCKENKTELIVITGMSPQVEYDTGTATEVASLDWTIFPLS